MNAQEMATSEYTARLEKTLKDLQERVKEQEAALKRLKESNSSRSVQPSEDSRTRLQQLRTFRAALHVHTPKEPYLPPPDSPLPALLAHRRVLQSISDSKVSINDAECNIKKTQSRLEKERSDLSDAKIINKTLEERIQSLKTEIDTRTQKTPDQIARDMIKELQKKKKNYNKETSNLVKAFNAFVDDTLAPMLAAEELGGPVVGEMMDIDDSDLEQGFSAQGKVKKSKKKNVSEDKRQQRIDQIWGAAARENYAGGEDDDEEEEEADNADFTEAKAAGQSMKDLTEQLLNKLVESGGGGGSDAYVQLTGESAAARFLVRSKVAQLHPRDSRKLRLTDFGKELD